MLVPREIGDTGTPALPAVPPQPELAARKRAAPRAAQDTGGEGGQPVEASSEGGAPS